MFLKNDLDDAGFDVQCFSQAGTALEAAHEFDYAAAIVDLGLPDMEGKDLIDKLRSLKRDMPIVIATGYDRDDVFGSRAR